MEKTNVSNGAIKKKNLKNSCHISYQLYRHNKFEKKKKNCGDHFCTRPRDAVVTKVQSPISKENPPTCCLIICEAKGVVYH